MNNIEINGKQYKMIAVVEDKRGVMCEGCAANFENTGHNMRLCSIEFCFRAW
jgi:hypothetical protein